MKEAKEEIEEQEEQEETKKGMGGFNITLIVIIVILAVAICITLYIQNSEVSNEDSLVCISENTNLYVTKTCPYCNMQKELLGNNSQLFNITECTEQQDVCVAAGVEVVPYWTSGNKSAVGYQSIEQLEELTGC